MRLPFRHLGSIDAFCNWCRRLIYSGRSRLTPKQGRRSLTTFSHYMLLSDRPATGPCGVLHLDFRSCRCQGVLHKCQSCHTEQFFRRLGLPVVGVPQLCNLPVIPVSVR